MVGRVPEHSLLPDDDVERWAQLYHRKDIPPQLDFVGPLREVIFQRRWEEAEQMIRSPSFDWSIDHVESFTTVPLLSYCIKHHQHALCHKLLAHMDILWWTTNVKVFSRHVVLASLLYENVDVFRAIVKTWDPSIRHLLFEQPENYSVFFVRLFRHVKSCFSQTTKDNQNQENANLVLPPIVPAFFEMFQKYDAPLHIGTGYIVRPLLFAMLLQLKPVFDYLLPQTSMKESLFTKDMYYQSPFDPSISCYGDLLDREEMHHYSFEERCRQQMLVGQECYVHMDTSFLCWIIRRGDKYLYYLDRLFQQGAPVEFRDTPSQNTLLFLAVCYTQPETVHLLLRHGADPQARNRDRRNVLELMVLSRHMHPEIQQTLERVSCALPKRMHCSSTFLPPWPSSFGL